MLEACLGDLFHPDKELTTLQMGCRTLIIFILAIVLVRMAGRRSFSIHSPFDNVVTLLLGATLSRAIVGASSFVATIAACIILVVLHRLTAWLSMHSKVFSRLLNGKRRVLYREGTLYRENLEASLISEKDLLAAVRRQGQVESLDEIEAAFMERNGEITVIKHH